MATINISDLRPAGSELFSDSESYLNQLTDEEEYKIQGGIITITFSTGLCIQTGVRLATAAAGRSSAQCIGAATAISSLFK